jgi:fructosamine-3-kinase
VTSDIVTPAVLAWVERTVPGARVAGCELRPLDGGAVARRVDQVTLHLAGRRDPVELVRKQAPAHEIAGLRAAQAVRADAAAIPEMVAWGSDWLITPLAPGAPLGWGETAPAALFDALAALHARYHGARDHGARDHGAPGLSAAIPRVTPAWWQALCQEWVDPQLREYAARHPPETTARARELVSRAAVLPAASALLTALPPTLLHGDVHPGNVLVQAGRATLIDWGSSRIGPAALDLANLVTVGSPDVAGYARTWQRLTGQPLAAAVIEQGYRWAALQIPVQYLPWTAGYRPTRDVEAALDRIDQALSHLPA